MLTTRSSFKPTEQWVHVQAAGLKEKCAKVGRDFGQLDITVMIFAAR
jgi:hypothetical protein